MKYTCRDCGAEYDGLISKCEVCNSIYLIHENNIEYINVEESNLKSYLGYSLIAIGVVIFSFVIWYQYWCKTQPNCKYSQEIANYLKLSSDFFNKILQYIQGFF